jgi:hypothetical protein
LNPDLSAFLPPDAFLTVQGNPASIRIATDPEETGTAFDAGWDRQGRLARYPLMLDDGPVQAAVERDARGFVRSLSLSSAEGEILRADFVPDAEGRPERGSYEDGESRGTLRFVPGLDGGGRKALREFRYDEEGAAVSVLAYRGAAKGFLSLSVLDETGSAEEMMAWEYDGNGRVVLSRFGARVTERFLDGKGRPTLVRVMEAGVMVSETTYQWNEAGELARSGRTDSEGKRVELKYAYTRDGKGNWVARSSVEYVERFGALVGAEGPTLVRTIRYR